MSYHNNNSTTIDGDLQPYYCVEIDDYIANYTSLNYYNSLFTNIAYVSLPIMLFTLVFVYFTFTDFRKYQPDSASSLSRLFVAVKISADAGIIGTYFSVTLLVLHFIAKSKRFIGDFGCIEMEHQQPIQEYMKSIVKIISLFELSMRLAFWLSLSIGLVTQLEKYIYLKYPLHYSRVKTPRVKRICLTLCLGISLILITIDALMLLLMEDNQELIMCICYLTYDFLIIMFCVPVNVMLYCHLIKTHRGSIDRHREIKIFVFIFGWMITNLTLLILIDLATLTNLLIGYSDEISQVLTMSQLIMLLLYPLLSIISLLAVYPAYWKIFQKYCCGCDLLCNRDRVRCVFHKSTLTAESHADVGQHAVTCL